LDLPEKVNGYKKISEIPDILKVITNLLGSAVNVWQE